MVYHIPAASPLSVTLAHYAPLLPTLVMCGAFLALAAYLLLRAFR